MPQVKFPSLSSNDSDSFWKGLSKANQSKGKQSVRPTIDIKQDDANTLFEQFDYDKKTYEEDALTLIEHSWFKDSSTLPYTFDSPLQEMVGPYVVGKAHAKDIPCTLTPEDSIRYYIDMAQNLLSNIDQVGISLTTSQKAIFSQRITRYIAEMNETLSTISSIESARKQYQDALHEIDKDNILRDLANSLATKLVTQPSIWIPLYSDSTANDPMTLFCRLEEKKISFVNASRPAQENERMVFQNSPTNNKISSKYKQKQAYSYNHTKGTSSNHEIIYKLLKPLFSDNIVNHDYYMDSFVSNCDLVKNSKMNNSANQALLKSLSTTQSYILNHAHSAFYYTLVGFFDENLKDSTKARDLFKKGKFISELNTFAKMVKDAFSTGVPDTSTLNALEKYLANFRNEVLKLESSKLISPSDQRFFRATALDLEKRIHDAREQNKSAGSQQVLPPALPSLDVTVKTQSLITIKVEPYDVVPSSYVPDYGNRSYMASSPTVSTYPDLGLIDAIQNLNLDAIADDIVACDVSKIEKPIRDLVEAFGLKHISAGTGTIPDHPLAKEAHQAALNFIEGLFEKIPCPDHNKSSFWHQIPDFQIENVMASLDELASLISLLEQIGTSFSINLDCLHNHPYMSLLQYKLFAITELLARRSSSSHLQNVQIYNPGFNEVITNPFFQPKPKHYTEIESLIKYFDPEWTLAKHFFSDKRTNKEHVESIYTSAFALCSTQQKVDKYSITPFEWGIEGDVFGDFADVFDTEGMTYTYYKNLFNNTPSIKAEFAKDPNNASLTEAEKMRWLVTHTVEGASFVPQAVVKMQRSVLRLMSHSFLEVHAMGNVKVKEKKRVKNNKSKNYLAFSDVDSIPSAQNPSGKSKYTPKAHSILSCYDRYKNFHTLTNSTHKDIFLERNNINDVMYKFASDREENAIHAAFSDPFDVVNRLIKFIESEISAGKKPNNNIPDYLELLENTLYQFKAIASQIEDNPDFERTLGEFFVNAYTQLRANGESKSAYFVAKLAMKTKEFMSEQGLSVSQMPDFVQILRDINAKNDSTDHISIYNNIVTLLAFSMQLKANPIDEKTFWKQTAIDFAICNVTANLGGLQPITKMFGADIETVLTTIETDPASQKTIMDEVRKLVSLPANNSPVVFKGCSLVDNEIMINLLTGEVSCYDDGKIFSKFPASIYTNFSQRFGHSLSKVLPTSYSIQKLGSNYHIKSLVDDTEYQISEDGKKFAMICNQTERFELLPVTEKNKIAQLSINLIHKDDPLYINRCSTSEYLYSFEKKLCINLKQTSQSNTYSVSSVKKDRKKLCPLVAIPQDVKDALAPLTASLVMPLEAWQAGKKLDKVRLVGTNLEFNCTEENDVGKAYSNLHEGFYLIKPIAPIPYDLSGIFLRSNDDENHIKVLIRTKDGTWIDFDFVENELIPCDNAGKIYLTGCAIQKQDFDLASRYLNSISTIEAFPSKDMQLLINIQQIMGKSISTSNATLTLKILLMFYENAILYKSFNLDKLDIDIKILMLFSYSYYILHENNIFPKLSEKEEVCLLGHLIRLFERKLLKIDAKQNDPTDIQILSLQHLKSRYAVLTGQKNYVEGIERSRIPPKKYEDSRLTVSVLKEMMDSYCALNTNMASRRQACLAHINPSLDFVFPPKVDHLRAHFFFYYEYLTTLATSQECQDFAKALELLNHVKGKDYAIVKALQRIARNPKGRASINSILNKRDAYLDAKNKYNTSTGTSIKVRLRTFNKAEKTYENSLNSLVRFQDLRHYFGAVKHYLKGVCQSTINAYLSKYQKKTKTPNATPWVNYNLDVNSKAKAAPIYSYKDLDAAIDMYQEIKIADYFDVKIDNPASIENTIPTDHPDPAVKARLIQEHEDYQAFIDSQKAPVEFYSLKPGYSLENVIDELSTILTSVKTQLSSNKALIMWRVNHRSLNISEDFSANRIAALDNRLDWKGLNELHLKGMHAYIKERLNLTNDEYNAISQALDIYHVIYSRYKHHLMVLERLKEANQLNLNDPVEKLEREYLVNKAIKLFKTKRATEATSETRLRVALEKANGFLFRQDQADMTDRIKNSDQATKLVQAATGWGKTSSVMGMLGLEEADGYSLILDSLPESQEKHFSSLLAKRMRKAGHRKVTRLEYKRNQFQSIESLQFLYAKLLGVVQNKERVPNNIRSLRSLELDCLSACEEWLKLIKENPNGLVNYKESYYRVELLANIARLIRVIGVNYKDEEKLEQDPFFYEIYSLGSPQPLNDAYLDATSTLIATIQKNDFLRSTFRLDENKQCELFPKDDKTTYEQLIAPALAEALAEEMGYSGHDKTHFIHFVLKNGNQLEMQDAIKWASIQSDRDVIGYYALSILSYLPLACKGYENVDYGLTKRFPNMHAAVPYQGVSTPRENEDGPKQYKNPFITLYRSHFTYIARGLNEHHVRALIQNLKKISVEEDVNKIGTQKKSVKLFNEILTSAGINSASMCLEKLSAENMNTLIKQLKFNSTAIEFFVRHVAGTQIHYYEETLENNAEDSRSMIGKTVSFSATPQHKWAHGPKTSFFPVADANGKLTHMILTRAGANNDVRLEVLQGLDPTQALDEMGTNAATYSKANESVFGVIDGAAIFRGGETNAEIAAILQNKLASRKDVLGTLFYDEQEKKFKVRDFQSDTFKTLDPKHHKSKKLFVYLDQLRHCATDVQAAFFAYFYVTVGMESTKENVGQSIGRAREEELQKIIFMLTQDSLKGIFGSKQPSAMDLFVWLIQNSENQDNPRNLQSQLQQLNIRRGVIDSILGLGPDPKKWANDCRVKLNVDDVVKRYRMNREFVVTKNSIDPWNAALKMVKGEKPLHILKKQAYAMRKKANQAHIGMRMRNKIKREIRNIESHWPQMSFPSKVDYHGIANDADVEVMTEVNLYSYDNKPNPDKPSTPLRKPDVWPKKLNILEKGWVKPSALRHAIYKVSRVAGNSLLDATRVLTRVLLPVTFATDAAAIVCLGLTTATTKIVGQIALGILAGYAAYITATVLACSATAILWIGRTIAMNAISTTDTHYVKEILKEHLPKKYQKLAELYSDTKIRQTKPDGSVVETTVVNLISNNKLKQWPGSMNKSQEKPFSHERKPLFQVVVIENMEQAGPKKFKRTLTILDVDQNDTKRIRKEIKEDNYKNTSVNTNAKQRVAIFDITDDSFKATTANFKDADMLLKDNAFNIGIAKTKWFSGFLSYNDAQLSFLAQRVQRNANRVQNKHYVPADIMTDFATKYSLANQPPGVYEKFIHTRIARAVRPIQTKAKV